MSLPTTLPLTLKIHSNFFVYPFFLLKRMYLIYDLSIKDNEIVLFLPALYTLCVSVSIKGLKDFHKL